MDVNILISKWEDISDHQNLKGYKALRISSECVPDLFIATDEDGFRCLLLFLPEGTEIKINGTEKEKLNLIYLNPQNVILIRLNDSDFHDLFNDLIVSLYSKIESIVEPNIYSKELIYSFHKWSDFFEDKRDSKLSPEQIKGLIGELFVLNELLTESEVDSVNGVLESWQGPFDVSNDFVFDDKNLEVKTKEKSKQLVKISSEFQLENKFGKGLELIIISVQLDLVNGVSISDLLLHATKTVRMKLGDLSILYKAINQIGLTLESSKEYNNYRYIITKTSRFDCSSSDFPKLTFSNIPKEISKLNYSLRIDSLADFLISENNY